MAAIKRSIERDPCSCYCIKENKEFCNKFKVEVRQIGDSGKCIRKERLYAEEGKEWTKFC